MRRRLIASTALIALAAVLVLGVPLGIVESHRAHAEATSRLEREADAVAARVEDRLEAHRPVPPSLVRRLVRPGHAVRVRHDGRTVVAVGHVHGTALSARSSLGSDARVVARAPEEEVADRVRDVWLLVALLAVGGIGAAVALAGLQARRLARPLERLAETSTRLGLGDFSTRAGRFGVPEIDAVGTALDTTAVRIARLIARERELSADVSHQLRTPLTALRLRLEELARLDDPALVEAEAAEALAEADRLERMISELLAAGRRQGGSAEILALDDLARRHAGLWHPRFTRAGRVLRLALEPCGPVLGTAGSVGQALDVLLENALRHGAGTVTLGVQERRGSGCLSVEDEGAGVPAGAEREIFRRGRSLDGGTGIGLHLARALVEGDGGRLVLARARPARFEAHLRLAGDADATSSSEPRGSRLSRARGAASV